MNTNTGLMLSEIKGPLAKLNENLSGKNGRYWLKALNKMLRKEEIPEPPKEVLKIIEAFNARKIANDKLETVITYLKSIPAVSEVHICDVDEDNDLLNINVYSKLSMFLKNDSDKFDTALFTLGSDGTIREVGGLDDRNTDSIFDKWEITDWSLKGFIDALIKLGEMYKDSVPVLEN